MQFRAISVVRFQPGDRVKLDEAQAFNARHLVELPAADGFRNVLRPFDLKPGAVFELDGTLPKNLAEPVELRLEASPAAAPAKKTARKA